MKQHTLIWILMLFTVLSIQGQSAPTEHLTGTWLFNDTDSFSTMDPMFQKQVDTIAPLRTKFIAVYSGRKMSFEADGNYTTTLSDGRTSNGTWSIDIHNTIQVIDNTGSIYTYQLTNISATTLILMPIVSGDTKSMMAQWHFNKL